MLDSLARVLGYAVLGGLALWAGAVLVLTARAFWWRPRPRPLTDPTALASALEVQELCAWLFRTQHVARHAFHDAITDGQWPTHTYVRFLRAARCGETFDAWRRARGEGNAPAFRRVDRLTSHTP